jgi:hypothetical protein
MFHTKVLTRRLAFKVAAGLSTVAMAAGVTALGAGAAQAASRAAPGLLTPPAPIAVNTANWSGSAGFGSTAPSWFEDSFGLVHLQGAARQVSKTGLGANLLGTLPSSARPARNVFVIVHTFAGTYADLEVATNGQLNLIDPRPPAVKDYTFVSLESITYRPPTAGTAIPVNGANWSGSAGFGSTAPSWFKDGSGLVHLQGAARQVRNTGHGPNLLGILPSSARPARNVFVIVHTFAGTYADLEVATNGQLNLIDPYGFAVKDYSFVSLEGISYSPGAIFNHLAPPFPGLNTTNWSGSAGFGSSEPGWNEDVAGVVHLQGAATQISLAGDTSLVATLPAVIRPDRTIYTIVHTFNGTYADLSIAPSGQVRVIDPRAPMGKDYTFVSLEGVTYHQ